jgi:predicted transcriptional regulator
MMKKQKILETIKDLPNEVNLNDLFEQLWVAEKIERGLEQIAKGETISHEKVVEHFKKKWGK